MRLSTKFRNYGDRQWADVLVSLPDKCEWIQEHYTLEMLGITRERKTCLFFQNKDDPEDDIVSYTIKNPFAGGNLKEGFKEAISMLETYHNRRKKKYLICPKCGGRATKLISPNTGKVTCQQCTHMWIPQDKEKKD